MQRSHDSGGSGTVFSLLDLTFFRWVVFSLVAVVGHIRDDFLITFMALLSMNVWKLLSSDVFLYLTIFNVHSMNEFGGLEPLGWQRSCLDS